MSEFLKGNFQTARDVVVKEKIDDGNHLEERFEREAMKRLGGSMAFVSRKKVTWSLDEEDSKDKK
jgi:hypothetical protein